MHKRVFTTALALLLSVCLVTGCGGGSASNPSGGTTPGGTNPGGTNPGSTNPGGTTPGGGGSQEEIGEHDYLTHDEMHTDSKDYPAGDHVWDKNNKCTVCGYTLPVTDGLVYTETEGGLKVGYDWENETLTAAETLVIPAYHDGKKVVEVAGYYQADGQTPDETSFAGAECKEVAVPNTVERVSTYAFYACPNLEKAYVGGGTFGDYVFYQSGVKEAHIAKGTLGTGTFCKCVRLTTFTLPADMTVIPDKTFSDCYSLHGYDIPSNVTEIGVSAFDTCIGLTHLTLPAGLTSIGKDAFDLCIRLVDVYNLSGIDLTGHDSRIANSAENVFTDKAQAGVFAEQDGFEFYTKDGKTSLIGYFGDETEITLPASAPAGGMYDIRKNAFYHSKVHSVTTGDGVTAIGAAAFFYCFSLYHIEIGKNVASIGNNAFSYCDKLLDVGDCSDALEIQAGEQANGLIARDAERVYTTKGGKGTIGKTGDYTYYTAGDDTFLISYDGSETDLTLPASVNGKNYKVGRYFTENDSWYQSNVSPTSVVFGNGVTEIGAYAFNGCTTLASVTFGTSLVKICDFAFQNTENLLEVTFPASLTYIGMSAFNYTGKKLVGLQRATFLQPDGWKENGMGEVLDLSDAEANAARLNTHSSTTARVLERTAG